MATKIQMQFKKGDVQTHYFQMDSAAWFPGGTLWFAAKPAIDNDNTDANAVINKSFNDTKIVASDDPMYLDGYVTYALEFVPADIVNVSYGAGEKVKKYLGEFQYVNSLGEPETFPVDDHYIEVLIYADIKRGTA